MEEKNVTGAFIVNLLKHLEIAYVLSPEKVDEQFILTTLDRMHKGFYKHSTGTEKAVGFEAN